MSETITFTIAGQPFALDRERIEAAVADRLPDPIREHYVVVAGRRFPPKQVLRAVTGLDVADFTTHQARRILRRLGFVAARVGPPAEPPPGGADERPLPYGGRQAAALEPYIGKWVAMSDPLTVLVAADDPHDVIAWLARHNLQALYGMFRVPEHDWQAGGAAPL